ncbi:phytanoyl-CoA dioxygenase [Allostella vacuolata]|nr:phytanoyl-CoA dioxygenase [Stella vacuolata]
MTTPAIGEAEIEAYERDGIVCLRGRFDAGWIARMAAATDAAMAAPGPHAEDYTPPGRPGRFFGDLDLWQRHDAFRRFVFESPAAGIAARLMRASRVNFFYDQLLVKEPGTAERTPWHQDQPYWAVDGRQVCSIWLPFDPVPADACVEYVAGSHLWRQQFNPQHFSDGTPYAGTGLPPLPDIEAARGRLDIRRWDLEPGDCLVFQAMIVHGAPGNRQAGRRRALATRWTGDDATFARRPGEVAIPTSDPGLAHGQAMDCALFPRVWPRP